MKTKNPLYVIKGKDVLEVKSMIDLVIKKFNLEPAINILQNIFYMLLEQVKNYAMLKAIVEFMEQINQKILNLGKKFGLMGSTTV